MQIIISGRHLSVTSEMKQHLEDKLTEILDKKNLKVSTVRAVLTIEKTRHKAEIIVNMKHNDITAVAETYDMYESIDNAVSKIDIQVRRYIDKVQDHHHEKPEIVAPLTETQAELEKLEEMGVE